MKKKIENSEMLDTVHTHTHTHTGDLVNQVNQKQKMKI